jgi:lipooligosaccharide transport system permease protein
MNALAALLPDVSRGALRVWQRNRDSFRGYYLATLVGNLGEHLIYLLGMGLGVGAYVRLGGDIPYLQFIAPGLVVSSSMWSSSLECTYGAFTRMTHQKTYDGILATPCSVADIVTGDILWGSTRAVLSAFTMMVVMAAFGLVRSPLALLVFPVVFLQGFVFASIGMIVTALSPSYFFFNYHYTVLITPMFFLSGIFFPISDFGPAVQWAAWSLPLTHAVDAVRALTLGEGLRAVPPALLWMAVASALLYPVAVHMIRRRLIK